MAVGRQIDDLFDGFRKAFERLVRQAVDQIEVDALKAEFARPSNSLPRQLFRLNTIDGFLHLRVKILHAEARAVKSDFAQSLHVFFCQPTRVNFDAGFNIVGKIEFIFDKTSNLAP